jgi:hypothetical protein
MEAIYMPEVDKKSYYAIIPADIRYDKTIPANAKLLYGEITALCSDKGFCWSSNSYFATLYNKSIETVSRWIAKLVNAGYICIEIDPKTGNRRRIYLLTKTSIPIGKNINTLLTKKSRPLDENVKPINKKNNTINNIYISSSDFIDYWNAKEYLPKIISFGSARQKAFKKAFAESEEMRIHWQAAVDYLNDSKFYTGRLDNSTWVVNVDWFLREKNYPQILELSQCNPSRNQRAAQEASAKKAREAQRKHYRAEYKPYLKSKSKKELTEMLNNKQWGHLRWLINEVLSKKED